MKKTIKLDVDGVLRDVVTPLLEIYNDTYKDNVKHDDIIEWDISKFLKYDAKYNNMFAEYPEHIFRDGKLYNPNTSRILRELQTEYNIHITTHQFKGLEIYTVEWLYKHKIPYDYLSFAKDKTRIRGDFLIDDGEHNLNTSLSFEEAICFDQPWNQKWNGRRIKTLDELIKRGQ